MSLQDPIEPALELARLRHEQFIAPSTFYSMAIGETVKLGEMSQYDMGTVRKDLYDVYIKSLENKVTESK